MSEVVELKRSSYLVPVPFVGCVQLMMWILSLITLTQSSVYPEEKSGMHHRAEGTDFSVTARLHPLRC